jgi:3-oxoacyl-[acyl-carrier-protein] synthase II
VSIPVIAGVGLVTPLGANAVQTWESLLAGGFITDHARLEADDRSPRVIQIARRAADQAMAQAGWSTEQDMAIVVGTSKGSVESWLDAKQGVSPMGLSDIAASLDVSGGAKLTLCGACASGLMALIRGAMMIRAGEVRRVLVVAAEASVHPLFLASVRRLGVLARPGYGCSPFDVEREGFLMSEAAAAVCLEAGDDGSRVHVERFAMGGDGYHLTSADPTGRVLAKLIETVAAGRAVDLVHAHGTGTVTNDSIELAALEQAVAINGPPDPCLYSHKGAMGHSLGAAGLVAVVLNVMAHQRGIVPPNVRTTRPMPVRGLTIDTAASSRTIRRSIVLASGFGGATAAVSLVGG